MMQKAGKILFQFILTLIIFSIWAGFALLVVNKYFYKDLPGYTIGRICIWELVALIIAFIIARLMIHKWENIKFGEIQGEQKLILNPKYGIFFLSFFLLALITAIWQFWIFSQNY